MAVVTTPEQPQTYTETAERMRAEAHLLDQLRGVLEDLADEAAGRIRAIADAKRVGAEHLDEMAQEES